MSRADKPTITHCLCVLADCLQRKYGEGFKIEIGGDRSIKLIGKDLINHEHEPRTIEALVSDLVDRVPKGERDKEIAEIYALYPRKRDPQAARTAIASALRDDEIPTSPGDRFQFLKVATKLYAQFCTLHKKEEKWIPYPQTWFHRKSYLNAAKEVLRIMQQVKEGQPTTFKRSALPSSWHQG